MQPRRVPYPSGYSVNPPNHHYHTTNHGPNHGLHSNCAAARRRRRRPRRLVCPQRPGTRGGRRAGPFWLSCGQATPASTSGHTTSSTGAARPRHLLCTLFRVHPALLLTLPTGSATLTPLQPLPQFRLHNSTNVAEFPPLIHRHGG